MNEKKRILVVGAGAIGGYIGGSLALAGHEVVFICRPQTAAAIREAGLQLELQDKAVTVRPGVVETAAAAFELPAYDLLVVAVKRYDTAEALAPLRVFTASLGRVLCLQNGIGAEEELAEILSCDRILPGTVTTAVGRPAPNRIRVDRFRGIGIAGGEADARDWAVGLSDAGLNCRHYSDARSMKWSKLLTNLIANPTSAILDYSPAEIFANPGLFRFEIRQLREALMVIRAQGIPLVDLPGTPVRLLAFCATYLPLSLARVLLGRALGKGRGDKMPSFHADLQGGAGKSEIGVLHGEVVRAGEALGVPTPVNRLLVETYSAMMRGEIPLGEYRKQPEKLLEKMG